MRKLLASVLVAPALLLGACGGDDDSSNADQESGAEREAYVDAITVASTARADNTFSAKENRCAAEVYVDVIGFETLRDNVELAEIAERPDSSLADFGIEIDEEQGKGIFDGISECVPDLHDFLLTTFTEGVRAGMDPAVDPACLRDNIDESVFETLAIREIVEGSDGSGASEEDAEQLVAGLDACMDLRAVMLRPLANDPQYPAGFSDCVSGKLTDEFVRKYWIAGLSGGDKATAQQELNAAGSACVVELGEAANPG